MIVGIREGKPAVNVKDRTLYAHESPYRELVAALPEDVVERLYEDVREDFWMVVVTAIAPEHGYHGQVYPAGNMDGWLIAEGSGLDFLEYVSLDGSTDAEALAPICDGDEVEPYAANAVAERDRFLRFAEAIGKAMESCRETFLADLRREVDALNARREAALVRGYN